MGTLKTLQGKFRGCSKKYSEKECTGNFLRNVLENVEKKNKRLSSSDFRRRTDAILQKIIEKNAEKENSDKRPNKVQDIVQEKLSKESSGERA